MENDFGTGGWFNIIFVVKIEELWTKAGYFSSTAI